mmetsp:Transcript_72347/g.207551  ORF Transcript_72347/g.207551 Transcript_72347/m.207551 type:complete len:231 (-) Transcript_72347:76-768(-)
MVRPRWMNLAARTTTLPSATWSTTTPASQAFSSSIRRARTLAIVASTTGASASAAWVLQGSGSWATLQRHALRHVRGTAGAARPALCRRTTTTWILRRALPRSCSIWAMNARPSTRLSAPAPTCLCSSWPTASASTADPAGTRPVSTATPCLPMPTNPKRVGFVGARRTRTSMMSAPLAPLRACRCRLVPWPRPARCLWTAPRWRPSCRRPRCQWRSLRRRRCTLPSRVR